MSILAKLSNKIQYDISKAINDPEADAYAKQQEIQKKQDAETKERKDELDKKAKAEEEAKAEAAAAAASLAERSTFSTGRAANNAASGILKAFFGSLLVFFILYGGHLAANEAIGYKIPFRILSFVYGCLFFFIEIPKSLIRRYWYKLIIPYYTFLPISTYQPVGDLETIFLGGFCYTEDNASSTAMSAVETLYKTAFDKTQIKTT